MRNCSGCDVFTFILLRVGWEASCWGMYIAIAVHRAGIRFLCNKLPVREMAVQLCADCVVGRRDWAVPRGRERRSDYIAWFDVSETSATSGLRTVDSAKM